MTEEEKEMVNNLINKYKHDISLLYQIIENDDYIMKELFDENQKLKKELRSVKDFIHETDKNF